MRSPPRRTWFLEPSRSRFGTENPRSRMPGSRSGGTSAGAPMNMAEGQPKSPSDSQRKQGAGGDNKSPPSVVSVSTLQGEILEQELVRVGVPHDKAEKATR